MHDLEIIAVLDPDLRETGSRNQIKVALYGNTDRIETKAAHHLGNADPARHAAMFPIHPDSNTVIETHEGRT